MKKIFLGCVLAVLFACAPPSQEAESGLTITAPDGFAVACTTNLTRSLPHYCTSNVGPTYAATVLTNVCTAIQVSSTWVLPTTTKGLTIDLSYSIFGSNAVGTIDHVTILFYTDSACATTSILTFAARIREFAAANNTEMLSSHAFLPFITVTADNIYYKATKTGGASTTLNLGMLGYYD